MKSHECLTGSGPVALDSSSGTHESRPDPVFWTRRSATGEMRGRKRKMSDEVRLFLLDSRLDHI